jgi:hypothetical protein
VLSGERKTRELWDERTTFENLEFLFGDQLRELKKKSGRERERANHR